MEVDYGFFNGYLLIDDNINECYIIKSDFVSHCGVMYLVIRILQKGSQEYIDATDLLDLYYEIRDELLVETFGDNRDMDDDDDDGEPDDGNLNAEQIQV